MFRAVRFAAILIVSLLFVSASVMASCPQHRLSGSWQVYFLPSSTSWMTCDLQIRRDGVLRVGSKCGSAANNQSPATGKLSITNCVITGQIVSQNNRYQIKHSRFNVDHSQIIGVLSLVNGRVVEFNSVRH